MQNGNIAIDKSNLVFSPSLSEQSFLLSGPGKNAVLLINNAGYHTYQLKPYEVQGTLFHFTIIFLNDVLKSVNLTIVDEKEDDNFVEKELADKKLKHDQWLLSVLGKSGPHVFNWGSIESIYDKKSWSASILIRYK